MKTIKIYTEKEKLQFINKIEPKIIRWCEKWINSKDFDLNIKSAFLENKNNPIIRDNNFIEIDGQPILNIRRKDFVKLIFKINVKDEHGAKEINDIINSAIKELLNIFCDEEFFNISKEKNSTLWTNEALIELTIADLKIYLLLPEACVSQSLSFPAAHKKNEMAELKTAIGGNKMKLYAKLGEATLPLKDIVTLKAGDVIKLESHVDKNAKIQSIDGMLLCYGQVKKTGNFLSLKLTKNETVI